MLEIPIKEKKEKKNILEKRSKKVKDKKIMFL